MIALLLCAVLSEPIYHVIPDAIPDAIILRVSAEPAVEMDSTAAGRLDVSSSTMRGKSTATVAVNATTVAADILSVGFPPSPEASGCAGGNCRVGAGRTATTISLRARTAPTRRTPLRHRLGLFGDRRWGG